jgi:hypothetical protein
MVSTADTRSAMGRASQYRTSSRIAPSNVVLTAIFEGSRERATPEGRLARWGLPEVDRVAMLLRHEGR